MLTASSSAWVLALKCQHSAANAGFGLPDVAALQQGKVTRASAWIGHGSDLGYCQSAWQPPSKAISCRTHTSVTVTAHNGHLAGRAVRSRHGSDVGY